MTFNRCNIIQASTARLNAERRIEILLVPGNCGLMGRKLDDDETKFGLVAHQLAVALDFATRRALISRVCTSNLGPRHFTLPRLHAVLNDRSPPLSHLPPTCTTTLEEPGQPIGKKKSYTITCRFAALP